MRLSNWTKENESRKDHVTSFPCCNALRSQGIVNMSSARVSGRRNENKSHSSITAPPSAYVTPAVHHTIHPSAPKKTPCSLCILIIFNKQVISHETSETDHNTFNRDKTVRIHSVTTDTVNQRLSGPEYYLCFRTKNVCFKRLVFIKQLKSRLCTMLK